MYEIIIKKLVTVTVPPTQAFEKISDTGGDGSKRPRCCCRLQQCILSTEGLRN